MPIRIRYLLRVWFGSGFSLNTSLKSYFLSIFIDHRYSKLIISFTIFITILIVKFRLNIIIIRCFQIRIRFLRFGSGSGFFSGVGFGSSIFSMVFCNGCGQSSIRLLPDWCGLQLTIFIKIAEERLKFSYFSICLVNKYWKIGTDFVEILDPNSELHPVPRIRLFRPKPDPSLILRKNWIRTRLKYYSLLFLYRVDNKLEPWLSRLYIIKCYAPKSCFVV